MRTNQSMVANARCGLLHRSSSFALLSPFGGGFYNIHNFNVTVNRESTTLHPYMYAIIHKPNTWGSHLICGPYLVTCLYQT